MHPMEDHPERLEQERARLRASLASVGDLRPGSLVQRQHRCGKPGCHCAGKDSPGHGPSWVLTRAVEGKTVTRGIPAGAAVQQARQQVEEYHRFRALVRKFIEVNEKLCDARLRQARTASKAEAEKGGSGRRSGRRSSRRSRRS
jgi:hypothetical protein